MIRTTLTIDDDILQMSAEFSNAAGKDIGEVLSDVVRQSIAEKPGGVDLVYDNVLGILILPSIEHGRTLTVDALNEIRDHEE